MTHDDDDLAQPTLRLLDPTGEVVDPERSLAPRLADLQGKVVGLVGVTRDTMERIGELLVERHGAREYVFRQKPEISRPCPDVIVDELSAMVDCLVVGVGV
jgi:hypothetical protein